MEDVGTGDDSSGDALSSPRKKFNLSLSLENLTDHNNNFEYATDAIMPVSTTSRASNITTASTMELQRRYEHGPVKAWLRKIGFKQYTKHFKKQNIWSLEMVSCLDKHDLLSMDITFNVKYLLQKIAELKEQQPWLITLERWTEGEEDTCERKSGEFGLLTPQNSNSNGGTPSNTNTPSNTTTDEVQLHVSNTETNNNTNTEPVPLHVSTSESTEIYKRKAHTKLSERTGSSGKIIFNQPGKWDVFISHTQRNGKATTCGEKLAASFEKRGFSVWFDVAMGDTSELAMKEGIENCDAVICIVTGQCVDDEHPENDPEDNAYFRRPYCIKELSWAKAAGVNIQPCCSRDDKGKIGKFQKDVPENLEFIFDLEFVTLDRSDLELWNCGVTKIIKKMGLKSVERNGGCGSCTIL